MMNRFLKVLTVAVLALSALLPTKQAEAEPPIAGEVKQFQPADQVIKAPLAPFLMGEEEITLASYQGRVVVLNFWATWCAPCVHEMPSLDRLNASLDQEQATVLTVSTDRNPGKVAPFLRDTVKTKTLPAATDAGRALAGAFNVRGLPTTFIIGADGLVKGILQGPAEWDTADAKALVDYYVKKAEIRIPTTIRASLD